MPDFPVQIQVDSIMLEGDLTIPLNSQSIVLFAPGSGSNRYSTRNQLVAQALSRSNISTLLVDLLTPSEAAIDQQTRQIGFDIPLLTRRLTVVIDWLGNNPSTSGLYTGLYGVGTGAAAALVAAAARPARIHAIVSRGGRVDLAGQALTQVQAPTLLIVGGYDEASMVRLNQDSYAALRSHKAMEVVSGATHLFEEPGAMERVSILTRDWFAQYLTGITEPSPWNPVT
ncbi:MAG: alpha/beta hydrolase [Chloroflexota bacterium]